MESDLIGRRFGPFILDRLLGAGGMGEVFLARQDGLERLVAVKVLLGERRTDSDDLSRFSREIQILARLDHPNVVKIFDAGESDGITWFAMEMIEGKSLREVLEASHGGLPVARALALCRDVARGLAAVHELGIVHRDIKPDNVMISRHGVTKVMDFGLAKDPKLTSVTATGSVMGTPTFLPPEMLRGEPFDHRVDIYQVGVLLTMLLTDDLPFVAESMPQYLQKVINGQRASVRKTNRQVSEALDDYLGRCLSPLVATRPSSATSLADSLQGFLDAPMESPARSARLAAPLLRGRGGPIPSSGPLWKAAATAVVLLIGALGTHALLSRARPADPSVRDLVVVAGLHRAKVTFVTRQPSRPVLELEPRSRVALPSASSFTDRHQFELTGLDDGKTYRLAVTVGKDLPVVTTFRTERLTVQSLERSAHLDRLVLRWRTSIPARSSLVWRTADLPNQGVDVVEVSTSTHSIEIPGLSPDRTYDFQIVSHTAGGEVDRFGPFKVRLLGAALEDFQRTFDHGDIYSKVQRLVTDLRARRRPQAELEADAARALEPLRDAMALIRPIGREFFDSPDVYLDFKLKVYQTLKIVEHVERLAAVKNLKVAPLVVGMNWGCFYQSPHSFQSPTGKLPGPVTVLSREFPGEGQELNEWRPTQTERDAYDFISRSRKIEVFWDYDVPDPKSVSKAEFQVATRKLWPLQFVELTLNDRAGLVVRTPPHPPPFYHWNLDHIGFDPALLVPGRNRLRVRVMPVPGVTDLAIGYLKFANLRLLMKN